jgi:hypothetical protein
MAHWAPDTVDRLVRSYGTFLFFAKSRGKLIEHVRPAVRASGLLLEEFIEDMTVCRQERMAAVPPLDLRAVTIPIRQRSWSCFIAAALLRVGSWMPRAKPTAMLELYAR